MKKILFLLLCGCVYLNAEENLYSLLKIKLTQEEYATTLQAMKRKGLAYCINTFKSDDVVLQDMALTQQHISVQRGFEKTFYKQYPNLLSMKNSWNADKTGNVVFEYIKRYINANIPFMAYYQTYAPYNKFPILARQTNNFDYLNNFFKNPVTGIADYFIPCMQMYDSKEYQEYLIKVINFIICKNCQNYIAQDLRKYQTIYDEILNIAKMEGFSRCIAHYPKDNKDSHYMPRDIKSGYFLLSHFLSAYGWKYEPDNIRVELDLYIHKAMTAKTKHNNTATNEDSAYKTPYVLGCMQIYDSKEYQAEIERIVKKYCKDCK